MGHEARRGRRDSRAVQADPDERPRHDGRRALPQLREVAHKYTILRSHSHNDNGHTTGYHYVMTGYRADFADGTNSRKPNNVLYPSLGSIVSRELGPRGTLPPYINLPHPMTAGGPGFYGAEHAPFVIEADPVQPDFEVKDLRPVEGIDAKRQDRRQAARSSRTARRQSRRRARPATMATYYEKAHDLMTSPAARKAFDIKAEPDEAPRGLRATRRSASARCWPGGWSRRAAGSSASITAAGTRTSPASRAWRRT